MVRPPLWLYAALGALALLAAAGWWVYEHGREVEKGKQAIKVIRENEDARKARDKADHDAAGASDSDLINGVRPQNQR